MPRGPVSLVPVKPVSRVSLVERAHRGVAGHLRDDRSSGDRRAPTITPHNSLLGDAQLGNLETVDKGKVGQWIQRLDRATHGMERGVVNVDSIDLERIGRRHTPGCGAVLDLLREPLPSAWGEELRIAEPDNGAGRTQHHGRSDHRSRQAAPSNLIDPGDRAESSSPDRILDRAGR